MRIKAILEAYARSQGKPVTVEAIGIQYPMLNTDIINKTEVFLERLGWIEPVPEGGHRITTAGKAYLARYR